LFVVALALSGTTHVDAAAETSLYMKSAYREFIGQGQEYFYSPSNMTFSIQGSAGQVLIQVGVVYDGWTLDFRASPSLTNGVYDKLASVNSPYMSVTGEHRGCSDTTGSFDVKEIEFDTNNVPVSFWTTFEQRCDGEVPSLTGEILYNAHRPVILQAPR
jgi:hypothetical protein